MNRLGRAAAALTLCLVGAACDGDQGAASDAARFVDSSVFRRAALEASLVNPDNGYSARRLASYTEADWGALPEWNPLVRPVRLSDLGAGIPTPDATWTTLEMTGSFADASLRDLGRAAFNHYPSQVEPALREALVDVDGPAKYGLWIDGERVGNLVWVVLPDGVQPAFTCATCHSSSGHDGSTDLRPGLANHALDYGALLDADRGAQTAVGRWGPGRVDVTPDDLDNATVIADLRPVRFQTHLQRAATVRNSLVSLALRIETLLITASGEAVRPPRQMVWGLATYIWGLGEALPVPVHHPEGAALFEQTCARCHTPDAFSGDPVPLEVVGTDPSVGASPWRTTGMYQVPSLRGVASRTRLTATGDLAGLDALLDPARSEPGHRYGLDLTSTERAALRAYLAELE